MKNKILILSVFLTVFSCTQSTIQRNRNINNTVIIPNVKNISQINNHWKGIFHFEASNRDNSKTSFDIIIKSLNDLSININEDGIKNNYSHIKAKILAVKKLK